MILWKAEKAPEKFYLFHDAFLFLYITSVFIFFRIFLIAYNVTQMLQPWFKLRLVLCTYSKKAILKRLPFLLSPKNVSNSSPPGIYYIFLPSIYANNNNTEF